MILSDHNGASDSPSAENVRFGDEKEVRPEAGGRHCDLTQVQARTWHQPLIHAKMSYTVGVSM